MARVYFALAALALVACLSAPAMATKRPTVVVYPPELLGDPDPSPPGGCDDEYECVYKEFVGQVTYTYDLRPLCEHNDGHVINDTAGHTYKFNICGYSAARCTPKWHNVYEYGVAVQFFGEQPACNQSNPECTDVHGHKVCCTQNCQVIGVGIPTWELKDASKPESGGIRVHHSSIPPSLDDPFWCDFDPKTGNQYSRSVTYDISCDATGARGKIDVIKAEESGANSCHYTIYMKSIHGCGCAPECGNKNCGPDGCGGFCGNGLNECPTGYTCGSDQVCCKTTCGTRECGQDGCGGQCGVCKDTEKCDGRQMCVPKYSGKQSTHNSAGTVAGSFFGGLFTAVAVGAVGLFIYRRQTGAGGVYAPYQSSSSAATPTSSTAAPSTSGAGAYGSL